MSENRVTTHDEFMGWFEDTVEGGQTVLPTTLSRREQLVIGLAHVRLQQNGHDADEAMQWATAQVEKHLDEE